MMKKHTFKKWFFNVTPPYYVETRRIKPHSNGEMVIGTLIFTVTTIIMILAWFGIITLP